MTRLHENQARLVPMPRLRRLFRLSRFSEWQNFFRAESAHGNFDVVGILQIEPQLRCCPEIASQTDCRVRRDTAFFLHDSMNARGGNPQSQRQRRDAQIQGCHVFFAQDFARMYGAHTVFDSHDVFPFLVIINDFHIICTVIQPAEADAVLLIDTDTVSPFPISPETFKPVACRNFQVIKRIGGIQQGQLPCRCRRECLKALNEATREKVFGVFAFEGSDHRQTLAKFPGNVLRDAEIYNRKNLLCYVLTPPALALYCPTIVAHTAVIGIDTPPVSKRTGALQRCFYARFLWQCAWENRKVRRFFRSGKANPAFAVALFISLNGDSHLLIRKETAMSCHITLVLGDATETAYETLSIYAAALLRILTLANTDPDTRPSVQDTRLILDLIEQIEAQKDAAHAEVMPQ